MSLAATWEPMNPALPVTSTFMWRCAQSRPVVVSFGNRCFTSKITQSAFPNFANCVDTHRPILIVRDGKDDRVVAVLLERVDQRDAVFVAYLVRVHPRIVYVDVGVVALQFLHEIDDAGVANVRAIFLERQAENQHVRIDDVDLPLRHQPYDALDDVFAHRIVDAPTRKNDLRVVADLLRLEASGSTGRRRYSDRRRVRA